MGLGHARLGKARLVKLGQGSSWFGRQGLVSPVVLRHVMARQARLGASGCVGARRGMAWQAWRVVLWRGRHGKASRAKVCSGMASLGRQG